MLVGVDEVSRVTGFLTRDTLMLASLISYEETKQRIKCFLSPKANFVGRLSRNSFSSVMTVLRNLLWHLKGFHVLVSSRQAAFLGFLQDVLRQFMQFVAGIHLAHVRGFQSFHYIWDCP